jgi:RNA polymerase sigma-70 factor, ECF subfamily
MSVDVAHDRAHPDAGLEGHLIERAARGDVDAFDALLQPRLDRLFRLAVAITRSEADARDAVQDACVLAWREVPRLRDAGRFDPWLSQIVVNSCRGLLRRRKRTQGREVGIELTDVQATRHGPISEIEGMGEMQAIQRAFERLDPTARSLLVLHHVEGRPVAEIARVIGSPIGTVKWRLSRARQALGRALEAEKR